MMVSEKQAEDKKAVAWSFKIYSSSGKVAKKKKEKIDNNKDVFLWTNKTHTWLNLWEKNPNDRIQVLFF